MGIGLGELIVIGIIALVVVGPKDMPKIARKIGALVGEAKGAYYQMVKELDVEAVEVDKLNGGEK